MVLTHIRLRHFRNLRNQELDVPREGVALVGENAQGKSNFLEAIYYLEAFRSFRGARDAQLVAFGEDVFRVVGTVDPSGDGDAPGAGAVEVAAAFQKQGRRKKVTVDGQEPPRLGDAVGRVAAVVFAPSDVAMVSEGPAERRRFLDVALSLNVSGYLEALQDYRHVLSQRNAALREDRGGALVGAWNEGLVRAGARVTAARARWIEARCGAFAGYYRAISGGRDATMRYRPSVGAGAAAPEAEVAEAFREALDASADGERRMRTTMVGPQRDELVLTLEGREGGLDVRDYGSGGQRRTAALALRLVEADTIRDARSREPIVLLDDVFAELDAGRSARVLELFEGDGAGQVIVTAPKEADVRIRRDRLPRWRIADGAIES